MKDIYKIINTNSVVIIWLCCLTNLMLISCNKANDYYEQLHRQPEIVTDYDLVYGVGDTMTISGRLNPQNGLKIRIGDADAQVISIAKTIQSNKGIKDSIDLVKVRISEEMGLGSKRPVHVTSAGITISAPEIEIAGNVNSGVLSNQLELEQIYKIPQGSRIIYCHSGTGNVFLWKAENKLVKIQPNGEEQVLFSEEQAIDDKGVFRFLEFNAGGLDPAERYFYFSARIREIPNVPDNDVYKLCKWDVQEKKLIVLNRTLYPNRQEERTLAAMQPFEGDIKGVKIFKPSAIYPNSKGEVYFNLQDHFITYLNATGNYTFSLNMRPLNHVYERFVPDIYNPSEKKYYSVNHLHALLPGTFTSVHKIFAIDAEEYMMYVRNYTEVGEFGGFAQLDLKNQIERFKMRSNWTFPSNNYLKPVYLTASFEVMTGPTSWPESFVGNMTMPGQKMITLFLQDRADDTFSQQSVDFTERYQLPVLVEMDFDKKMSKRYAPKKLIRNGYHLQATDKILNYDPTGMLYMTADNQTLIVKTRNK